MLQRISIFILFFSLLSACSSTQHINMSEQDSNHSHNIAAGDHIILTMKDGAHYNIRAQVIDNTNIIATDGTSYAFDDISHIEIKRPSPLKSVSLAGGLLFGAFILAVTGFD